MRVDLPREYAAALDTAQQGHRIFGVARVETGADGLYAPAPHGRLLMIMPANWGGVLADIDDLVAWDPQEPGRWWRRIGAASVMGLDAVRRAALFGEDVKVHETPQRYLQAARGGCVILDATTPLWREFEGVRRVLAPSLQTGQRVKKQLRPPAPRLPKIAVPAEAAA